MVGSTLVSATISEAAARPPRFTALRRFAGSSPLAVGSLVVLLLIILMAIFAPVIAPYDPLAGDYSAIRQPPTAAHLMGTDDIGRDVLSRIIYGARTSLIVGFGAVLIGDTIGLLTGILSGYVGGRTDLFGQRLLEVLLAFPGLILATLFVVALGTGLQTVIVAIAITRIPASNRVVRAVTLATKHLDFVEAARVSGASAWRLMLAHIAPQTVAPFLVVVSLHLGIAIIAEAALSFLGIGIPPPDPSWGTMIGGAISSQFNPPWWLAVFPGLAIAITVFTVNMVGDTLRDLLDPNLRGRTDRA
jgi:peptide/nickel transport system permease protein